MPRARRDWQTLRPILRRLLRETTAANSYWDDTDLLDRFNDAIEMRYIDLAQAHEGWVTETRQTNIVANQGVYLLEEGISRVKRVLRVFEPGTNQERVVPLIRNERWHSPTFQIGSVTSEGHLPTFRIVGDLLFLEPAPTESETNGLRLEVEFAPPRIVLDTDKLPSAWPTDILETLLIYDTWDLCLGMEEAMSPEDVNHARMGRLQRYHQRLEARFMDLIEQRTLGPIFGHPYHLGD